MTKSLKKRKAKVPSVDMDARARFTFAATSDVDDSEAVSNAYENQNSIDDVKDYLPNVLSETNKKGLKNNETKGDIQKKRIRS